MKYRKGWFGDSYRHYLASKGVATKRYFAPTDIYKGNRAPAGVKRGYALRLSESEQLARKDELIEKGVLKPGDVSYLVRNLREKQKLSDVVQPSGDGFPSVAEPSATAMIGEIKPLPSESVPLSESQIPPLQTEIKSTSIAPVAPYKESEELSVSPEVSLTAEVTDQFADTGADVSEPNTVTSPISTPGTPGMAPDFGEK